MSSEYLDNLEYQIRRITRRDRVLRVNEIFNINEYDNSFNADFKSNGDEKKLDALKRNNFDKLLRILQKYQNDDENTLILSRVNKLISIFCGEAAESEKMHQWIVLGDEIINLKLYEADYTQAELGWKTWGGSMLLSKLLAKYQTKWKIKSLRNVIELGCGTGLAGLVLGRLLYEENVNNTQIVLTDYQKNVLENVKRNISLNFSTSQDNNIRTERLDWLKPSINDGLKEMEKNCDFIIAADVVYDMELAINLPITINRFLGTHKQSQAWIVIPIREKFMEEIETFISKMMEFFDLVESEDLGIPESESSFKFIIFKRKLYHSVEEK